MYYQIINADEEIVLVKGGGGGGWWHTLIIPSDFSVFGFMTAAQSAQWVALSTPSTPP